MKNLIILFAAIASFYSCTKETDDMAETLEYTGEWQLVKMTGNFAGSETTGLNMEWQETYNLNEDDTFTKTRVRGDSTTNVSGTYILSDAKNYEFPNNVQMFLELNHSSQIIIESCRSSSNLEHLYFNTNNRLLSLVEQCDGPGLEYVKRK